MEIPRPGQKESANPTLSGEVKEALVSSLRLNGLDNLQSGVSSLRRHALLTDDNWLCWACQLETHTHVILVWHIATSFCDMDYGHKKQASPTHLKDFRVAMQLSMYCAYLVAFTPKLLPDPEQITKSVFDQVVIEAKQFFEESCSCGSHKSHSCLCKYEKMMMGVSYDQQLCQIQTNIQRGALLGKRLISLFPDSEIRWKFLAEFWAEILLFSAPSNDHAGHAEHLAMGGELITHLWALLTHAGIVSRPSNPNLATSSL